MVETVARFGVDPSLIEIEVTESARGRGGDLLRCVADDLRGRGFSVAVDDFGVDNANVSLFVQLEFDVLKMDRSLIWGIDATDRTMRVVSGLASLCDDLSIESVAEGIETEQQLEALKTTGCTRAQGRPYLEFEQAVPSLLSTSLRCGGSARRSTPRDALRMRKRLFPAPTGACMAATCQFDDIGSSWSKNNLTLILYFFRDRREPGDSRRRRGSATAPGGPGRHEGEEVRVKGFLERLQWKLSGMMQGRRGADTLSNFFVVVGIVLLALV